MTDKQTEHSDEIFDVMSDLSEQNSRYLAIILELLPALEPFARRAEAPGADKVPDDGTVTTFMADCRAARAAIAKTKEMHFAAVIEHPEGEA